MKRLIEKLMWTAFSPVVSTLHIRDKRPFGRPWERRWKKRIGVTVDYADFVVLEIVEIGDKIYKIVFSILRPQVP